MSTNGLEPPLRPPARATRLKVLVPAIAVGAVMLVAAIGFLLRHHAASEVNKVALAASPKDVTVVRAKSASYRPEHRFVGTLRPWVEAKVGPQFLSAYISTVLVRPGASVRQGQILGTLDCRDASARSHSISLEARALQAQQSAYASQAARMTGLLDGGYIAANEVDLNTAQSSSEQAKLESERAKFADAELSVNDCVLRAPFDGDVGERWFDPGAFVRPGEAVVSIVDRSIIRLVVDVPENDYAAVAPGNQVEIHMLSLDQTVQAPISRRSPTADPSTRTIHTEIDLPDPDHHIPVNTTAAITVGVGQPFPATEIPVIAADLSQDKAKLFTVVDDTARAHTYTVLGESEGSLFIDPKLLQSGTEVVLEGRASLVDKDKVTATELAPAGDAGRAEDQDSGAQGPEGAQAHAQLTPEMPATSEVNP